MFLKFQNSTRQKRIIKCACSNCDKLNYCLTEFSCFRASTDSSALFEKSCFGCFKSSTQILKVILI